MPTRSRKRSPPATRRRALELLEASIDGCTQAIMLAYGFKTELLVELVNAGLATASIERMVAGGRRIAVTRMRITGAGRQALNRADHVADGALGPALAAHGRGLGGGDDLVEGRSGRGGLVLMMDGSGGERKVRSLGVLEQ